VEILAPKAPWASELELRLVKMLAKRVFEARKVAVEKRALEAHRTAREAAMSDTLLDASQVSRALHAPTLSGGAASPAAAPQPAPAAAQLASLELDVEAAETKAAGGPGFAAAAEGVVTGVYRLKPELARRAVGTDSCVVARIASGLGVTITRATKGGKVQFNLVGPATAVEAAVTALQYASKLREAPGATFQAFIHEHCRWARTLAGLLGAARLASRRSRA
jgi:hypothetical protein